jgi:Holliday junction DNA helicase RuvB
VEPDSDPILRPEVDDSDVGIDQALRPRSFDEFVGQAALIENLRIYIQAAQGRGEPLDHVLLSGLPGLGKTTLAHLIAKELGVECRATSGPALVRAADLAGILTNLARGDLLFIDEIHRLPAAVEEFLYSAMEDFAIDILIDQGPAARSVRVPLQRFTLVGATTREGRLTGAFRSRFGIHEKLEAYSIAEIERILVRTAGVLRMGLAPDAATTVAHRARGTPRVANRLLRRLRDLAQVRAKETIDAAIADEAFRRLGIDDLGLEETDRRILGLLHRAHHRSLGVKTLAASLGEAEDTIEEVYEPHLLRLELIRKTPRGRELSDAGQRWCLAHPRELGDAPDRAAAVQGS